MQPTFSLATAILIGPFAGVPRPCLVIDISHAPVVMAIWRSSGGECVQTAKTLLDADTPNQGRPEVPALRIGPCLEVC